MSYIPITSDEITTGKPVANTTQTKIKDNFDDHEDRIDALEGGSAVAYPPIVLSVNGYYGDLAAYDDVCFTTPNFDLTITGIRLEIKGAGSSGTTTIDIKKKSGVGAFASVLTTLPSVAFSAGNYAVSTNAVLDSGQVSVLAGDFLRLDITTVQTGGRGFIVRIDYTKT